MTVQKPRFFHALRTLALRSDRTRSLKSGFTLVELSIVLIIVGLIIGGIFKGAELIRNTRTSMVITQMKTMTVAYNTFFDSYKALPGDMADATTLIPGCNAANACRDGNGDHVLGVGYAGIFDSQAWASIPAAIESENTQFWKHLALAGMIQGVQGSATEPGWGETHPETAVAGGIHARTSVADTGFGSMNGLTLVLRNQLDGSWGCKYAQCAISPIQAKMIDTKLDDGLAAQGDIQAISNGWSTGCGLPNKGTNDNSGYSLSYDATCDEMFFIKQQ